MSPGQSRLLLALATLLVGLVAALVWLEPPEETEPGMPVWVEAFPDADAAAVTRLELSGGETTVVAEKVGADWRLVQPVEAAADGARVDGAVRALVSVELGEPFDRTDASVYGLAPAGRVVTATTAGGDPLRLELGDDSPAGAPGTPRAACG